MLIYVAGKIRGDSKYSIVRFFQMIYNVYRAWKTSLSIWRMGFTPIVPHMNSFLVNYFTELDRDDFIYRDLEILNKCDALFMMDNWKDSIGAKREHGHAVIINKPIYYGLSDLFNSKY